MNLLETESYSDVLTSGRRRKRPKLTSGVNDLSTLLASAEVRENGGGGRGMSGIRKYDTGPMCIVFSVSFEAVESV